MKATIFSYITLSLVGLIRAGPFCIECTDAPEIRECLRTTIQCADNEKCYLEKVTNEDLSISFNAGCRSTQVCDIMDALATGRKKRLVNCAACCNDAPNQNVPCNANLCGLGPVFLPDTCLVCDGIHSDVASCTTAATCPPNEVCYTGIRIVGTALRYVFGCYEERVCYGMVSNENQESSIHHPRARVIHGDQGMHICDACCKGDRCNAADCFYLKKNMTIGDFNSGVVAPSVVTL
ncbi:uncharacterized protein LOC128182413 isoform X1 [Crassostrea angulata]|uniref:uncharacterized protein isoform X1 n=1 Tax=Magallana gigas TaxID=29159 RepID=UPI0022B20480|nr:uncharacterized protein LOC128182413 isoform X1 [Crassostrea angulata]